MFFNSWDNHSAEESVTKAFAWCMAAIETGTYVSRVVIPNPTCTQLKNVKAVTAFIALENILLNDYWYAFKRCGPESNINSIFLQKKVDKVSAIPGMYW